MTASIHTFPLSAATSPASRTGGSAAGKGVGQAPLADAQPVHVDLVALADCHAADLRLGSISDAVNDLIERASDERCAYAHRPVGAIAEVAFDALRNLQADLDVTIARLAERAALAEATELDERLSGLPFDEAMEIWRELTPAQQSAVIWVQARALNGGAS